MTENRFLRDPSQEDEPGQPARSLLRGDLPVAVGVLIFAIAAYLVTWTFGEVPRALARGMQPAQYPRFLLYVLAVLSALLAVQGWKARPSQSASLPPALTLYTAVALIVTAAAVPYLGILLPLVLFCAVLPPLWGLRRPLAVTAFAVVFPLLVYGLFSGLLGVRFPVGVLQNLF